MAEYVNNKELLAALIQYDIQKKEALEKGLERPQPSDYICTAVMKIAEHYSYKPNFIGYSYRDDMVLDALEGCLNAVLKHFDPTKSSNPFGYFTQICHYAFLHRIKKEKKQTTIKNRIIMEMPVEFFELQEQDDADDYVNTHVQFLQETIKDADNFNYSKKPKKAKATEETNIENFYEE